MNIAIEDIKYLERKYQETPGKGKVYYLAMEGKYFSEIVDIMEKEKQNKKEKPNDL
jgi:hypothetical protein